MQPFLEYQEISGESTAFEECQLSTRIMERNVQIQEDTVDRLSRVRWIRVAAEGAQVLRPQQTTDAGGRHHHQGRHQVQVEVEQHLCKMEAEIAGVNAGKVDIVPVTVEKEMHVAEEVGGETLQSVETRYSTTMVGTIALHLRVVVVVVDLHHLLQPRQVQVEVAEAGTRKLTT